MTPSEPGHDDEECDADEQWPRPQAPGPGQFVEDSVVAALALTANHDLFDLSAVDTARAEALAATLGIALRRLRRLEAALLDPPGRRRPLACLLCGTWLDESRADARFCSDYCRGTARQRRISMTIDQTRRAGGGGRAGPEPPRDPWE